MTRNFANRTRYNRKTNYNLSTPGSISPLIKHLFDKVPVNSQQSLVKSALLLSCLTALPAIASETTSTSSDQLDVITVTAEKRASNILDVPSSITALTADELQDAEIVSITELSHQVPNLHIFTWGGRRDSNVFIRGIGPGLFTEPTVGFYVDGVNYTSGGMFDMDLLDIERVEVLRGPQGTLYGGNSLAGIINITTKKPGDYLEGKASLSADSLSRRKFSGTFNTPIIEDQLSLSLALSALQSDGHIQNIYLNEKADEREDITGRLKLRWLPTENLETLLTLDLEHFRGGSYAMGPAAEIEANPDQVNHDFKGVDDRDSLGASLVVNWSGETVDFTSVSGWRDWRNINTADQDGGSNPQFVNHSKSDEKQWQISQELRLASNSADRFHWLTGLYGYQSKQQNHSANIMDYTIYGYGGPYTNISTPVKENSGYAAFGQLDTEITDQLTLTLGLRWDHEKRNVDTTLDNEFGASGRIVDQKSFNELLPKISLAYRTAQDDLIYATAAKGYRAGGFDILYPDLSNPSYDSESSINYELGYKATFLDNRLSLSAAAFIIDIKDQQVQQLVPGGLIVTDNAGKSRSQGLELETRFVPAQGWIVSMGGGYTDAEYKDYKNQVQNGNTLTPVDYSGNKMPFAPEFTANVSVQNRQPITDSLNLFTRIDGQYIGEHYFDAPNKFRQDPYNLVNLKLGVESESWDAYIWMKNALDDYYSKVTFDMGAGVTSEAGDPRSFGVTVNARF